MGYRGCQNDKAGLSRTRTPSAAAPHRSQPVRGSCDVGVRGSILHGFRCGRFSLLVVSLFKSPSLGSTVRAPGGGCCWGGRADIVCTDSSVGPDKSRHPFAAHPNDQSTSSDRFRAGCSRCRSTCSVCSHLHCRRGCSPAEHCRGETGRSCGWTARAICPSDRTRAVEQDLCRYTAPDRARKYPG